MHRLAGALAYCGAPQLEATCKHLNHAIKHKQTNNIDTYFSELEVAVAQLKNNIL